MRWCGGDAIGTSAGLPVRAAVRRVRRPTYLLGPAEPRYLFTDTNAPAGPERFYRLQLPRTAGSNWSDTGSLNVLRQSDTAIRAGSPLNNSISCRSRRKEAQIPSENQRRSEPPHVVSYFFKGRWPTNWWLSPLPFVSSVRSGAGRDVLDSDC